MPDKNLMTIAEPSMAGLHAESSTGMGFYIVDTPSGLLVILEAGEAMPLYPSAEYYCVDDLVEGMLIPSQKSLPQSIEIKQRYPDRVTAIAALKAAAISPAFTGSAGAMPLIATDTLPTKTKFYRYLSAGPDARFSGTRLSAGTYLTSQLDGGHADSGFGAVGRYALPIPLPASYVIEYELPALTAIEVGTVAPNFGQSGGGVEIHLPSITPATQVGRVAPFADF